MDVVRQQDRQHADAVVHGVGLALPPRRRRRVAVHEHHAGGTEPARQQVGHLEGIAAGAGLAGDRVAHAPHELVAARRQRVSEAVRARVGVVGAVARTVKLRADPAELLAVAVQNAEQLESGHLGRLRALSGRCGEGIDPEHQPVHTDAEADHRQRPALEGGKEEGPFDEL